MSSDDKKDPSAVKLGRKGGAKGGPARMAGLTPEERREMARRGAMARWYGGYVAALQTTRDYEYVSRVFDPVTATLSAFEHFETTRTAEAVVVNAGRCPDCLLSLGGLVGPVTMKAVLTFQDDDKGKTTSKTVRIDWECQLGHAGCHGETQPIVGPPLVRR